jgi:segregation and condensation protein A
MDVKRYEVKLENVFEGPMDLLVYLIRKHEVDIHDIPIAMITDQYLAYLQWIQAMDIDTAGDFLLMAATLTQIKSRMLLPAHEALEPDDDPRMEIVRPLSEYLQIKQAAEQLCQRDLLGQETFVRPAPNLVDGPSGSEACIDVGLFELIDAFQKIVARLAGDHRVDLTVESMSLQDRMAEIVDVLEQNQSVCFEALFSSNADKFEVVLTFLAVLELVKLCLIKIVQHEPTGRIRLYYQ